MPGGTDRGLVLSLEANPKARKYWQIKSVHWKVVAYRQESVSAGGASNRAKNTSRAALAGPQSAW